MIVPISLVSVWLRLIVSVRENGTLTFPSHFDSFTLAVSASETKKKRKETQHKDKIFFHPPSVKRCFCCKRD